MSMFSTAKMQTLMGGKAKPENTHSVVQESRESFTVPQLRPGSSDMEQVLANILGPSASKKHTPMD